MKTYLLSAVGVIFLSVIVSLILPEGKMNKPVSFVMRLICIFVLVAPLATIFKKGSGESGSGGEVDYAFVENVYSDHQSEQLEKLLEKEFAVATDCNVNVVYDEGEFKVGKVEVGLDEEYKKYSEQIYAYLTELGYINITVYAKGS